MFIHTKADTNDMERCSKAKNLKHKKLFKMQPSEKYSQNNDRNAVSWTLHRDICIQVPIQLLHCMLMVTKQLYDNLFCQYQ